MALEYIVRPIVAWDFPKVVRVNSPFRASVDKTWRLLEHELDVLDCKVLVIEMFLQERDIRIDGKPRADAKLTDPGIILSFGSKYGPLRYPSARFPRWTDNLHALALGLESLRRVNRYGISARGEQYTGWKSLPAMVVPLTPQQAAELLSRAAGLTGADAAKAMVDADAARSLFRAAAMKTHPDTGGNQRAFEEIQAAKTALYQKHGIV